MPVAPKNPFKAACLKCGWHKYIKLHSDVVIPLQPCPKCGGQLVYKPDDSILGWLRFAIKF